MILFTQQMGMTQISPTLWTLPILVGLGAGGGARPGQTALRAGVGGEAGEGGVRGTSGWQLWSVQKAWRIC